MCDCIWMYLVYTIVLAGDGCKYLQSHLSSLRDGSRMISSIGNMQPDAYYYTAT